MHEQLRNLPLFAVLQQLGITTEWKSRKDGTEWSGACPVCKPKANRGNFSFHVDGRFRCFSCPAKGKGAIDLVLAIKQCGFQQAVEWLRGLSPQVLSGSTVTVSKSHDSDVVENQPFAGTYEKFAVPSAWLLKRGLN